MWDGFFDLMPVKFKIGYNFGEDYYNYNTLGNSRRNEYENTQINVLTSFFLTEMKKGRTFCHWFIGGNQPMID